MAKIDLFKKVKIDVKGQLFDAGELYTHAHDWLEWRKFDIVEKKYATKTTAKGKDVSVSWSCTRDVDEYSQFEIGVDWQFNGMNDVKMQHEGKDITLQSGNVVIMITAVYVSDYNDKWEESRTHKFMKSFFERYLYVGQKDRLMGELWGIGWDLYNEMKAYLNLYQA
ncbi:hypothetical protein HOE41_01910 [Candidatus Woesearchaeota archaeon]|jgi:hypothetical protein|nr:hypothetical protein [Candidatus Woesearchaeota archaeon]